MVKNFYPPHVLALLLATIAPVMSAQTMIVVEADGTQHRFNTDYVEEVRFEETTPVEEYTFTSVTADPYSNGNVVLNFATDDDAVKLKLDVYGPSTAKYLHAGTYTVGGSNEFYIAPGETWTNATVGGDVKSLKSGTMTVERADADSPYKITFDLVLGDDSALKGTYQGMIPGYDTIDEGNTFVANEAKYAEKNGMVDGEFYLKFNDTAWSFEMAIDFFTDATDGVLPVGTYTYSATNEANTFGSDSYIDIYSPYQTLKFADGSTITVTKDGETYTFDMQLKTQDGNDIKVTYTGTIN